MSRTKKGSKGPGYDYWGKRPLSGCGHGKLIKVETHRKERKIAKVDLNKGNDMPKRESF
jgi:hypothetical protein